MRVLPRTVRGTWLLAAAAWAGLSAFAWGLLPPRPRAVMTLSGHYHLSGIGPGGRTVTLVGAAGVMDVPVPVRIWDTIDGMLQTVVTVNNPVPPGHLSSDGRWLASYNTPSEGMGNISVLDIVAGREDAIPETAGEHSWTLLGKYSPDGRWLVLEEHQALPEGGEKQTGIRLWDLEARRLGPYLPASSKIARFSDDGRVLAAAVIPAPTGTAAVVQFAVWEAATGRELARVRRPPGTTVEAVTGDGTGLLVGASPDAGGNSPEIPTRCRSLDMADGRDRWSTDFGVPFHVIAGGRRLVHSHYDLATRICNSVVVDTADGRAIGRFSLDQERLMSFGPDGQTLSFGPDGQTLLVLSERPLGLDAVWAWLSRHGVPAPKVARSIHWALLDAETGRRLLVVTGADNVSAAYAPDGKSLAILDSAGTLSVWDIPPRKPLAWFAAAAAAIAVPVAWLARRRAGRPQSLAGRAA